MKPICRFILAVLSMGALPAAAATTYVDWTSFTTNTENVVSGTITNGGTASVTLSTITGGINNLFDDDGLFSAADYTDPVTLTDVIQVTGGTSQVFNLAFSNPVVNPRMHIYSLSNPGVGPITWNFSNPFSILSSTGNFSQSGGNNLIGDEGNGTIQFNGTFSTLSWTTSDPEFWTGIQVGVENVLGVPEPSRILLIFAGIASVVLRRRRG